MTFIGPKNLKYGPVEILRPDGIGPQDDKQRKALLVN